MALLLYCLGTVTLVVGGVRLAGVPISDWFYIGAVVAVALKILLKSPVQKRPGLLHPLWAPALLLAGGGMIAGVQGEQQISGTVEAVKTGLLFTIWISTGIAVCRSEKQTMLVLAALTIGATATAVTAVIDAMSGSTVGPWVYGLSNLDNTLAISAQGLGRFSGTTGHPNHLGRIMAVVLPIVVNQGIIDWRSHHDVRATRWAITIPLLCTALWLSGSVSGVIGATVGTVLVLLTHVRKMRVGRRIIAYTALAWAGLGIVSYVISADRRLTDFASLGAYSSNLQRVLDDTGPSRSRALEEVWTRIADHPWVGYGLDQGTASLQQERWITSTGVHNTIIQCWLGAGLFGLIGVLWIYWMSVRLAIMPLAHPARFAGYTVGLAASAFGWMLIDMSQPSIYLRYTWITVALLFACRSQARLVNPVARDAWATAYSHHLCEVNEVSPGMAGSALAPQPCSLRTTPKTLMGFRR